MMKSKTLSLFFSKIAINLYAGEITITFDDALSPGNKLMSEN
tara:strand:+ start:60 stop:185 length:126 start_codon:yes stop_codon:yes gene_type:complete